MTREQWLWMQASVALMASAARAMRRAESDTHVMPTPHEVPR
jgi:hypothetical protein